MELNQLVETCVSREEIYEGVVLHVVKDTVRLPNGALAPREFCLHPGAVAILALCDDGTVLMEHQYRYAHGRVFYEIPAGKLDRRDEPPLLAAARELREETGISADVLTPIANMPYRNMLCHQYLCVTDCPKDSVTLQEGETVGYTWVSEKEFIEDRKSVV